jgi:Raf kinase inhibitor-like YbhB/YbcL family protein
MKLPPVICLLLAASIVVTHATAGGRGAMNIASTAFKDGAKIPIQYVMPGASGKNVSVPLSRSGAPTGTKSFALSMVDPHPFAQNWVHWLVINMPAATLSLTESASRGKMPAGSIELKNSFGDIGYGGPEPPAGTGDHPYVFTIYALSVDKLNLPVSTSLAAFTKAIEGKVLGSATVMGKYGR